MKRPRLPLPPQPALYAVTAAIQGPWTLHGIARHLYPQLKEELQKQGYPESTPLSLYWWLGWLLAMAIGNMLGEMIGEHMCVNICNFHGYAFFPT